MRHLCPVHAYSEWIDALNEEEGYMFCKIKAGDQIGTQDQPMTSQQFLKGFQWNLIDVDVDPTPYGTHSFHCGGCQWLVTDLQWSFIRICQ
ncbi:hypothetical protein Moror_10772 [Moniliophthora roreri MCA 2997]|uniref:Uncharacterized protein n=1 Tax=Moniliophthora roreri (strain MCA 2997) TaxID=1381753 RepID=V2WMI8_MONRO|nr:hypothetical protein Moror_10772 [Moniliophthora roreri MCA 2997]